MLRINIFYMIISAPTILCVTNKAYGPFALRITSFTVCHSPKPTDCTAINVRISGPGTIAVNTTVLKTCSPAKGKLVLSANGNEVTRMHVPKPCDHVFIRSVFDSLYNINKKCEVLKGQYVNELNIGQLVTNYFGGSFFYGNISFKTYIYSDECNFSCSSMQLELTPET